MMFINSAIKTERPDFRLIFLSLGVLLGIPVIKLTKTNLYNTYEYNTTNI